MKSSSQARVYLEEPILWELLNCCARLQHNFTRGINTRAVNGSYRTRHLLSIGTPALLCKTLSMAVPRLAGS